MPATATPAERVELKPGPPPAAPAGSGGRNWSTRRIERTIKYESDRNVGFGRDVMRVPGCEQLENCIQCGTCSGVCPLSIYMDHSPRQVMALTRADFRDEVLRSHTIWLCASCYACSVECPRQIRITDIMYELKQRAIRDSVYPRHLPTPVLAKEFAAMVRSRGRITESFLVMLLYLKTSWIEAMGNWRLGLGLMSKGRFPLKPEGIRQKAQLERMLAPEEDPAEPAPAATTNPTHPAP